jgi:hypothetical protein
MNSIVCVIFCAVNLGTVDSKMCRTGGFEVGRNLQGGVGRAIVL